MKPLVCGLSTSVCLETLALESTLRGQWVSFCCGMYLSTFYCSMTDRTGLHANVPFFQADSHTASATCCFDGTLVAFRGHIDIHKWSIVLNPVYGSPRRYLNQNQNTNSRHRVSSVGWVGRGRFCLECARRGSHSGHVRFFLVGEKVCGAKSFNVYVWTCG